MFLIQYIVATCIGYTNLIRINSVKSLYGVEQLHITSDGPGVTLMLSLYKRYSSLLSAMFPKQVPYDYYKKNTKTSFSATVKRALKNCSPSDTLRFLFFRQFFQYLLGAIERLVARSIKKIGLTVFIKKVYYFIFKQPVQKIEDDKLNYMKILWVKYRGILDLREYCKDPDIKNYIESVVQDIETSDFDTQIDRDRFINLSIFLSKFIKNR